MAATVSRVHDIKTARAKIVGDSPLITHRYVNRRKDVPVDVSMKEPTPLEEFISGIYWITDEIKFPGSTQAAAGARNAKTLDEFLLACSKGVRFGIPAVVIKTAAIDAAAKILKNVPTKVSARSLFFIRDEGVPDGLVEIKAGAPAMREDLLRIGDGAPFSRYRPMFTPWSCEFDITYDAGSEKTLEEILKMINCGGATQGIGEWRKARGGTYGAFHVEY
ncbi:MAG: hypothetical protein LUG93_16515 [Lachnospiraceae bacterium]|nr:hypothetical protein [Lachnospiraceae bacterium]